MQFFLSCPMPSHRILAQVLEHPWLTLWRPKAHVEAKPQYGLNQQGVDPSLLRHISDRFGFKEEHVDASLKDSTFNHATATYSLLEEMGIR